MRLAYIRLMAIRIVNATNYAFYGLERQATLANDPAVFVAPRETATFPWDFTPDSALFDDLLALVDTNLCIDDNRVFSTGFSFGAMMSYALSITRQTKLRGVSPWKRPTIIFPMSRPIRMPRRSRTWDDRHERTTCPWVNGSSTTQGGKYCDLTHATDNGCDTSASIPTTTVGSKSYLCYEFPGCKAGYPSRCVRSTASILRRAWMTGPRLRMTA